MRLRSFLVFAVILGINTPLCTGGVFALAGALAQLNNPPETLLMSRAPAGYLACRGKDAPAEDFQTSRGNSCSNTKVCLAKMTATAKEIIASVSLPVANGISHGMALAMTQPPSAAAGQYAGAGPPFSSVLLSARILIQRE